jgi:integrase
LPGRLHNLTEWLAGIEGTIRHSTYIRYEGIVRNHIAPTLGRTKLARLTPNAVRKLYADKGGVLAPASVYYIHVTLHKALKAAVLDGLIPRSVCDAVKPPQVDSPEVVPFTSEQVKHLLDAAKGERLEALFILAIHTGLRRGGLLGLKWSDIDEQAGKLIVQRSLTPRRTFESPTSRPAAVPCDSLAQGCRRP